MPVLVTAFGPFGGRMHNSSSLVLHALRESLPDIRTRILPVDAVLAPSRLRQALLTINPTALVMLGEAAGSKSIRLETTAWNENSFSIPDIAGRQPSGTQVRAGAARSISSTLPLDEIHKHLSDSGHPVSKSDDPGRYLCNQLFFSALHFLETSSIRIPAGFIHLPLETDLSTSAAASAIAQAINLIQTTIKTKLLDT